MTEIATRAEGQDQPRTEMVPAWLGHRLDPARHAMVRALVQGRGTPDRCAIQLCTNDYLGLATHSRIVEAVASAAGADPLWMSSVFFAEGSPQRRLEARFAEFLGTEDCVIAQSGYCGNLGLLQAIARPGTHVYIDQCAHASLWHGTIASRCTAHRFAHNEAGALEALVRAHGPGVVLVDSIYSHNGRQCPLSEFVSVGGEHGCLMVVDESHALGTHGPRGAGLVADVGVDARVHVRTASLAKAFVARAGLIAASRLICDEVRYAAGPAVFSSACMEHDLAGLQAALDVIVDADDRRERLRSNATDLRNRLRDLGYEIVSDSQILALESGLESETLRLRRFLEENGIHGSVFCSPATRMDESLVRLSLHAGLTQEDRDRVIDVCRDARRHVAFGDWASTRRRIDVRSKSLPNLP